VEDALGAPSGTRIATLAAAIAARGSPQLDEYLGDIEYAYTEARLADGAVGA
jgi:hypothetical protein